MPLESACLAPPPRTDPLNSSDPEIADSMRELNAEYQLAAAHEPGRRLLNRVARELNKATWPVATTDDFVLFATDTEQYELSGNSVPPSRRSYSGSSVAAVGCRTPEPRGAGSGVPDANSRGGGRDR